VVKWLNFILALVLTIFALLFFRGELFTRIWHHCLVVSVPLRNADALIVLGGESRARPLEAARLFKQGMAPWILVTGEGDTMKIRRVLLAAGVPDSSITLEPKATSTYMNALLLKPFLESSQIRNALIITSPFHTRRALCTFRKVMPEISFGVTDAAIEWWTRSEGRSDVNYFAAMEFLKIFEYYLLYQVSPFLVMNRQEQN
jgi:uncharacterized SAM-binding protein YcdF (DUF218 family)